MTRHAEPEESSESTTRDNLNWETGAILPGAIFVIMSSTMEQDWLQFGVGVGMATAALLLWATWPKPSLGARRAIQVVGLAMVLLLIVGVWQHVL